MSPMKRSQILNRSEMNAVKKNLIRLADSAVSELNYGLACRRLDAAGAG